MADKAEHRASLWMKIAFRVFINVGIVWLLSTYFDSFFILGGGLQAVAFVGLTFTVINAVIVPLLTVLSLPIKLFAWIVAFLLVNIAALYIVVMFVDAIDFGGITVQIGGGIIGWMIVAGILGVGNWLVRVIVK